MTSSSKKKYNLLRMSLLYIGLSLVGVTMVLPLVWMLSTSLKMPGAVSSFPPEFIPRAQETVITDNTNERQGVFTTIIDGKETRVLQLKTVRDGVVVRNMSTGQELTLPIYTERNGKLVPTLKPVRHVKIRWQNYPDAWNALQLENNWLSFEVPARRFKLFGSTYEVKGWTFEGFPLRNGFLVFYLNSILIALITTVGQVGTSCMAAFAFARLRFPFRDALFLGYLGTLMVPFVVTMIPVFALFNFMGLYDTLASLALPGMFSAYGTFLMRQFFLTVPKELEDAASIDGCGLWGIFTNVMLPLSGAALATLTTFTFLYSWNNFMWPLIMIDSDQRKTLMLGLHTFMGRYSTDWTLLMAASVMVMIPVLVVFILGQRYFVKGIQMSGIKG